MNRDNIIPLRQAPGADGPARPGRVVTPPTDYTEGPRYYVRVGNELHLATERGYDPHVVALLREVADPWQRGPLDTITRRLDGPPRHISIMDDLRNDWRSTIEGIRNEPYTHGLIAILGFLVGLLLVALPVLVGVGR